MPPSQRSDVLVKLKAFRKDVEKKVNAATRNIAIAIVDAVAEHTPVDTGEARSNWLVGIGSPRGEVVSPHAPGHHQGIEETENLTRTMSAAREALSGYAGGEINITNNVGHIRKLDEGGSQQSPGDFVGVAIAAVSTVKAVK